MSESHALVFLKTQDQAGLPEAIWDINQIRRQRLYYSSLVLSAPRQGWVRLVIGESGVVDHLLMRNLSGRLGTLAFELQAGMLGFAYRLHEGGRTTGAFESNLTFYVNQRLQMITTPRDTELLDLVEPIERYVLKRYQARLRRRDPQPTGRESLPDDLQAHYAGDASQLVPVLRPETDLTFVTRLLEPGFNPEAAFEYLISVLALPYLRADEVDAPRPDGLAALDVGEAPEPGVWHGVLPEGWLHISARKP